MTLESGLILMAVCLAGQAFFSGSEIALMGADRLLLQARADGGDAAAGRVLAMLKNPTRLVGTCLAGVAVSSVAGTTIATTLVGRFTDRPSLVVAAVLPVVTVIFCELVPKSVFHQFSTAWAPRLVVPLFLVSRLITPVLWLMDRFTALLYRVLGVKGEADAVRREDIQLLLDNSPTGDIRAEEREMILRVFNFSETSVRDAMVPLIEVTGVPETATVGDAIATAIESGFSRLVVYRKRVDRIVGVVMHADLMFAPDNNAPVSSIMHTDLVYAPETKRVDQLFVDLRRRRQRIAVVVDEYGGGVGLISIEDILEELVGDIEDEFDRRRPLVRRSGEGVWTASARVEGEALLAITGFELPEGDYETLAGYLLSRLGHVPAIGEKVLHAGWSLEVTKANERAILEVCLTGPPA